MQGFSKFHATFYFLDPAPATGTYLSVTTSEQKTNGNDVHGLWKVASVFAAWTSGPMASFAQPSC